MFVNLHRHSEFSLLDGVGSATDYAERAADLGQTALALTDHGTLAGALYHIEACEAVGVKPIVGIEAYFREDIDGDRERMVTSKKTGKITKGDQWNYSHQILLAKNLTGFKNLMRLSTISFRDENFYRYPSINWKIMRDYSEGIIASTSCVNGLIPELLYQNKFEEAEKYLRVMQDIYGDDFYLEIQPHDFEQQKIANEFIVNCAETTGIPLVATADTHYPDKNWQDTQQVLFDMKKTDDPMTAYPTNWLTSEEEMFDLFAKYQTTSVESVVDAIANTEYFADRCEHYKIDKSPKIPKAAKSTLEAERILREWCNEGLKRIDKAGDKVYLDRLEEEFDVMRKLKVLDYFVIVGDMVRWAKDQGIRVGPGRGSAAGSLINYLTRITAIDPIGYDLLFERFLNEYRTELPDIDIDFQSDRRDEVKQYLVDKWGEEYVVDVSAFQSFGFKGVVKDVGRALGLPYDEMGRATKDIPDLTFNETWETLRAAIPELDSVFKRYPKLQLHCYRLEGQMKSTSRHAAAVIVTNQPAFDLIPMMRSKDGTPVTQWSERANAQLISPYGFLKIDMLVTDALTTQADCLKLIEQRHGVRIDFEDVNQFPVNTSPLKSEKEVVEAFTDGSNLGVFQFGSRGILGTLREIQPETLEHIIAANALHRPGTLSNGVMRNYAKRKNGMIGYKLASPVMEEFVGGSFGLMIYQEQVMQIFRVLGKDVESSAAAVFLKVVAKGIARDIEGKQKLQKYYDIFAEGCAEKGIPQNSVDEIWSQILEMTTYSFNRSHSAGYALQAYQDKWLKQHYPIEFYACLLTTEDNKIPAVIKEAKQRKLKILPPNINTSDTGFSIDGDSIRFGLLGIKMVGDMAIQSIKQFRPYKDYADFYDRVPKAKVKKNVKQNLFLAGAFDEWGGRTKWILSPEGLPEDGRMTDKEIAESEKAILGYVISKKSGLEEYTELLESRIFTAAELDTLNVEKIVVIGGEIDKVKDYTTSRGKKMAFVDLALGDNKYSAAFFGGKLDDYEDLLVEGNVILISGEWDPERKSVKAGSVCTAEQLAKDLKEENNG